MHRPGFSPSGDIKERARRRLSSLGFSNTRRKTSPGTGVSGIVPRVGRGRVGPPFSTPCAWPRGLRRLPSPSRQSPRQRSSRFPSTAELTGGIVRGCERAGISSFSSTDAEACSQVSLLQEEKTQLPVRVERLPLSTATTLCCRKASLVSLPQGERGPD